MMAADEKRMVEELIRFVEDTSEMNRKLMVLNEVLQSSSVEVKGHILKRLLERYAAMQKGLTEASRNLNELQEMIKRFKAPPWYSAVFIRLVDSTQGKRAMVLQGHERKYVTISEEVDPESLRCEDEVILSQQSNCLLFKAPFRSLRCGEIAAFVCRMQDDRLMLKTNDEKEIIVEPADALRGGSLQANDLIRYDHGSWMGLEKIEHTHRDKEFFLEEVKEIHSRRVGGQKQNLDRLIRTLSIALLKPEVARQYQLDQRGRCILLIGPPGCGKTLMTRVAASEIARLSNQKCRFGVVKPAEWENPYVGVTQKNIRSCFQALREAARESLAVLFLDEIESIGRIRGGISNAHADKFLAALLAELDGFQQRQNIAIIAATNRKDLVDPALLERIGEVEIQVRRPSMEGAEEIFRIHLPSDMPYSPNSQSSGNTREEIIHTAVSKLYSPNADNQVCTLHFRNKNRRAVTTRDLISGRLIRQICLDAAQSAFYRHLNGGRPGLTVGDMQESLSHAIDRMTSTLSLKNVYSYLPDLERDMDIVDIRPVIRKVKNPYQYLILEDDPSFLHRERKG